MEQLSFGLMNDFNKIQKTKEDIAEEIKKICRSIEKEYKYEEVFKVECSELGKGKAENHNHNVSVKISSSAIFHIYIKKSMFRIVFLDNIEDKIELPDNYSLKKSKSYPRSVYFDIQNTDGALYKTCYLILDESLKAYKPSERFGCCEKYIECSNQKKCLHSEKFYAKACQYKENLEAGRIFYGENRNID